MNAYLNDSSHTLVSTSELRIFINKYIRGKELYQVTRYDRKNDEFKYTFFPRNLVQTLQLESSHLSSNWRSFDRSSDHFFDCSSDRRYDSS